MPSPFNLFFKCVLICFFLRCRDRHLSLVKSLPDDTVTDRNQQASCLVTKQRTVITLMTRIKKKWNKCRHTGHQNQIMIDIIWSMMTVGNTKTRKINKMTDISDGSYQQIFATGKVRMKIRGRISVTRTIYQTTISIY